MIGRWLEWIIILCLLLWLGWTIYDQRTVVIEQIAAIHPGIAALSFVPLVVIFLLEVAIWRDLFGEVGYALSFREAFEIIYISSLGRYVPGRIWQFSSAVYLLHDLDVPAEIAVALAILSQLLSIVAGTLVALPILFWWIASLGSDCLLILCVAGVAVAFAFVTLFPSLWLRALNWGLSLVGRPRIPELLSPWRLFWYVVRYLIVWIGLGLAFFILALAVHPLEWTEMPVTVSAFAFAYIVGYLVVFVPGGLGVREGAMVIALSLYLPGAIATSIAILSRLWLTFAEFAFAGVAAWLHSRRQGLRIHET